MRVHVESIDREIVGGELQGVEDLLQRQRGAVPEYDDVLWAVSELIAVWVEKPASGLRFIFDLMNRSKCFWFMLLEW